MKRFSSGGHPNLPGPWTAQKLGIVAQYLDIYTTAMKNQSHWKLLYLDAFAGSGKIVAQEDDQEGQSFIAGSAERALAVQGRPFDRLVFVESSPERCRSLRALGERHRDRDIRVHQAEANEFLRALRMDWKKWRGVLFLDPFGPQVEWKTIEAVAAFEALDTWILFPTSAIQRMLPLKKKPDDIAPSWVQRLNLVYGGDEWRALYKQHFGLFGDSMSEREAGAEGLLRIYKEKLAASFGERFLGESRSLKNSKGSILFHLLFLIFLRILGVLLIW